MKYQTLNPLLYGSPRTVYKISRLTNLWLTVELQYFHTAVRFGRESW